MSIPAKPKISACLVVFNEEKIIRRCLESIRDLVDEIIIVHDGECRDTTLDIAREFTDKIFVREHIGIAEPLRSFSYAQANHEWILQIDADEYFEEADHGAIRALLASSNADAYIFKWELWDGSRVVRFPGLQKLCFFRKDSISYQGLPQAQVAVRGKTANADLVLHHRPSYDCVSWATANRKRAYWLKSHVQYFFPELVEYECFNDTADSWVAYTERVRRWPLFYLVWYPLKNFLGQMKNGLWKTAVGRKIALQQYAYYFVLYLRIWQKNRELKSRSSAATR